MPPALKPIWDCMLLDLEQSKAKKEDAFAFPVASLIWKVLKRTPMRSSPQICDVLMHALMATVCSAANGPLIIQMKKGTAYSFWKLRFTVSPPFVQVTGVRRVGGRWLV